jgi:hypothetical protein
LAEGSRLELQRVENTSVASPHLKIADHWIALHGFFLLQSAEAWWFFFPDPMYMYLLLEIQL